MATPPLLDPLERGVPVVRVTADPVAGITALIIGLVAVGLLVVAVLAVYAESLPTIEGPVVLTVSALFGLTLLLNIAAATVRALRRSPGL